MDEYSAEGVLSMVSGEGAVMVDLRFCDLPGVMQHFSVPAHQLTEESFTLGFGFDGSSIRGYQDIHESDLILVPDPKTAVMDPFREHATLSMHCWVKDPTTGELYSRDPRNVAKKAEEYVRSTGLADTAYFGPEVEFFIFDDVRFGQNNHSASYYLDSVEGTWNSDKEEGPNLGHKPRDREGYFPLPPMDMFQDLRTEMVIKLEELGIDVELQRHEVATAGQAEIDMRYDTLLRMADKVMLYKYVIKNVAFQAGKTATFMPKPLFEDNGSGMHVHQSLWSGDEPLFHGETGYANLSDTGRWYIGGLIKHGRSLMAFCAPSTNSYKRLVPGYETPVNLVYSQRNRSAAVRVPPDVEGASGKRIEFRSPDASSNPYLAFAALVMAGLDGVANRIEPPAPVDDDIFKMSAADQAKISQVPSSLEEALWHLEQDNAYLKAGGVFTDDLIEKWIEMKRKNDVDPLRQRPHPWEFMLYYDI